MHAHEVRQDVEDEILPADDEALATASPCRQVEIFVLIEGSGPAVLRPAGLPR